MIKSSGAWCNLCENPILFGMVNVFGCTIIKEQLHSCDKCKPLWDQKKLVDCVDHWPNSNFKKVLQEHFRSKDVDKNGDKQ